MNRKGWLSLNVQIISDANNLIRNVNARFPGSIHDSFIWRNSKVLRHLERRYNSGVYDEYLFGDSGYPLQPWLMTPISDPSDEIEEHFNQVHKSIRSGVERSIGLYKGTFRCMSGERKFRYEPHKVTRMVNACAVLHNILVANNVPFNRTYLGPPVPVADALPTEYHDVGEAIRRQLAERIY